jgi:hypothetical protein
MMEQFNKREEYNIEKIRIQSWLNARLTTPKVPSYEKTFNKKISSETTQTIGVDKNKMHDKQIERHFQEFKKGGLQNGKFRNING